MKGHKDSVMKNVQGYRDMFSSVSSDVHALIPLFEDQKFHRIRFYCLLLKPSCQVEVA